jgi:hypothetical protein
MTNSSNQGFSFDEARAALGASYDTPSRGAYRPPTNGGWNRPMPSQPERPTLAVDGHRLTAG